MTTNHPPQDAGAQPPAGMRLVPVEPDIFNYIKGIYEFLESTTPAGFATEVFRLLSTPTRAQRSLLDALQGDTPRKCAEAARQDKVTGRPNRSPIAAAPSTPAPDATKPEVRQPLTEAHLCVILLGIDPETKRLPPGFKQFARAIEAAHGITANGGAKEAP